MAALLNLRTGGGTFKGLPLAVFAMPWATFAPFGQVELEVVVVHLRLRQLLASVPVDTRTGGRADFQAVRSPAWKRMTSAVTEMPSIFCLASRTSSCTEVVPGGAIRHRLRPGGSRCNGVADPII